MRTSILLSRGRSAIPPSLGRSGILHARSKKLVPPNPPGIKPLPGGPVSAPMPNTAPGNPNDPNEQNRRSEMIATILWYSLADKGTRTTGQAPAKTTAKTPTKTPTKGLVIRTKEIIQDVDSIGRQYCVDTNQGGLRVPCPGVVEVPEKKERVRNNRVYEMIAALGELHTGNPSDRKVDSVFNRLDKLNVAELQKVVDFYAGRPGATLPPKDVKDQLTEAVTKKRTKPYTAKIPDPTPDEPPIPLQDPDKTPAPEAEETPQPPPPPEPEAETPPEAPKPPKEKKPRTRKPKATKAPTTKADRTGSPRNKTEAIHDIVDIVTRGEQSTSPAPVTSSETSSTESDTEKTPNTSQEGVSIPEPFEDEGDFTGEGGESEAAQPETTKPEAPKQPTPPPDNSNLPLPDEFQEQKEQTTQSSESPPLPEKPKSGGQRVRDAFASIQRTGEIFKEVEILNTRKEEIKKEMRSGMRGFISGSAKMLFVERGRRKALDNLSKEAAKAHEVLAKELKGNANILTQVSKNVASPKVGKRAEKAAKFLSSVLTSDTVNQIKVSHTDDSRGYYVPKTKEVLAAGDTRTAVMVHEMGHWIESTHPGVLESLKEFADRRFGDEKFVSMNKVAPGACYDDDEEGRKDSFDKLWDDPAKAYYVGKVYKKDKSTEILSMGLEELYHDPLGFAAKDPEYFDFIVSILDGSGRKKTP